MWLTKSVLKTINDSAPAITYLVPRVLFFQRSECESNKQVDVDWQQENSERYDDENKKTNGTLLLQSCSSVIQSYIATVIITSEFLVRRTDSLAR